MHSGHDFSLDDVRRQLGSSFARECERKRKRVDRK